MSVFLRILRYFLKYGGKAIRWKGHSLDLAAPEHNPQLGSCR